MFHYRGSYDAFDITEMNDTIYVTRSRKSKNAGNTMVKEKY